MAQGLPRPVIVWKKSSVYKFNSLQEASVFLNHAPHYLALRRKLKGDKFITPSGELVIIGEQMPTTKHARPVQVTTPEGEVLNFKDMKSASAFFEKDKFYIRKLHRKNEMR